MVLSILRFALSIPFTAALYLTYPLSSLDLRQLFLGTGLSVCVSPFMIPRLIVAAAAKQRYVSIVSDGTLSATPYSSVLLPLPPRPHSQFTEKYISFFGFVIPDSCMHTCCSRDRSQSSLRLISPFLKPHFELYRKFQDMVHWKYQKPTFPHTLALLDSLTFPHQLWLGKLFHYLPSTNVKASKYSVRLGNAKRATR